MKTPTQKNKHPGLELHDKHGAPLWKINHNSAARFMKKHKQNSAQTVKKSKQTTKCDNGIEKTV